MEPELPEVVCQYLLGYFMEIGPVAAGGFGVAPVSHAEIEAWQRNTGIRLDPWEARAIRRASVAFVRTSHEAADENAEAPWADAPYVQRTPRMVADSLRSTLRKMAR